MLQIGTRNAQNFELLKVVGQQTDFPVLFKRGMGITLEESLNACEYVATERQPPDRLLPARHEDATSATRTATSSTSPTCRWSSG